MNKKIVEAKKLKFHPTKQCTLDIAHKKKIHDDWTASTKSMQVQAMQKSRQLIGH